MFKKLIVTFLMLILLLITGCNRSSISERSFVSAIGLDLYGDNEVKLTLQIVKPFTPSLQGTNIKPENPVWTHSTTGETIFKSIRAQLETVNKMPYYSHVQLIVISEELAKKRGIDNLLDVFERDHELRLKAEMILAKGMTAEEVLNAKSNLDSIPASHIADILNDNKNNPLIHKVNFKELIEMLDFPAQNATLGVIQRDEMHNDELTIENMKVEGIGVFEKDKLIGYLNNEETLGTKYIRDEIYDLIMEVPNPFDKENIVTIEQIRNNTKKKAVIDGENIKIIIDIKGEGNIASIDGKSGDFMINETQDKIEKSCEELIKKRVLQAIDKAQREYKSDFFEFGELVNNQQLKFWKENEENWKKVFEELQVEVNVSFNIRRTGLISNPLKIR